MKIKAFIQDFLSGLRPRHACLPFIALGLPFLVLPFKPALAAALIWAAVALLFVRYDRMSAVLGPFILFWLYVAAECTTQDVQRSWLVAYAAACVGLAFLLALLQQIVREGAGRSYMAKGSGCILFLLSVPALMYLGHEVIFGVALPPDAFYAMGQTNIHEAADFFFEYIGILWLIVPVLLCILSLALFRHELRMPVQKLPLAFLLPVLLLCTLALGFKGDRMDIPVNMYAYGQQYQEELAIFRETQAQKKNGADIKATKTGAGEITVVVIGESLSKRHMGLYGYQRDTTPLLNELYKKGELIRFENVHSSHTHTMQTLSLALTEADIDNGKEYFDSPTIIDVARAAGYETAWISNQPLLGAWDNLVSIIANSADTLVALNKNVGLSMKTHNYDRAAVDSLEALLAKKTSRNRFIIVHLMGSHGDYCDRYPKEFEKYGRDLPVGEFGHFKAERMLQNSIRCYDNSVYYNDRIVADLIGVLRSQKVKGSLLYFSDHAEDVLGGKGHNAGTFTYDMTHIPMVFWGSPAYQKAYGPLQTTLKMNAGRLFSNDYIYDTLIGLMKIQTAHYSAANDLSARSFDGDKRPAYILSKEKNYRSPENTLYALQETEAVLAREKQNGRVLPHRVDTTGKLADVLAANIRSFEMDVYFNSRTGRFDVGHDEEQTTGKTLEDFLQRAPEGGFDKIWLDTKNFGTDNIEAAVRELKRLDSLYKLKAVLIVESSLKDKSLSRITEAGFHASYYLPTNLISDLLEKKDQDAMTDLAKTIAAQVKEQKVAAVSFDIALYPFVKNDLEKFLDRRLVYHTWDTDLLFGHEKFLRRLKGKPYYGDRRIQTILVSFPSPYSL